MTCPENLQHHKKICSGSNHGILAHFMDQANTFNNGKLEDIVQGLLLGFMPCINYYIWKGTEGNSSWCCLWQCSKEFMGYSSSGGCWWWSVLKGNFVFLGLLTLHLKLSYFVILTSLQWTRFISMCIGLTALWKVFIHHDENLLASSWNFSLTGCDGDLYEVFGEKSH